MGSSTSDRQLAAPLECICFDRHEVSWQCMLAPRAGKTLNIANVVRCVANNLFRLFSSCRERLLLVCAFASANSPLDQLSLNGRSGSQRARQQEIWHVIVVLLLRGNMFYPYFLMMTACDQHISQYEHTAAARVRWGKLSYEL